MYFARIISISFRPEMADAVAELHRTSSVPLVANEPGLVVVLGLLDPVAGRASSITLWETAADRERAGIMAPGADESLARYGDLLTGPYVRDLYDVTRFRLWSDQQTTAPLIQGHTTAVYVHPHRWSDGSAALRSLLSEDMVTSAGINGVMLFENADRGRVIIVELVRSNDAFSAGAAGIHGRALELWHLGVVMRPPETHLYPLVSLNQR
jgi:hypothetical protein